jgi:hypothetical protein
MQKNMLHKYKYLDNNIFCGYMITKDSKIPDYMFYVNFCFTAVNYETWNLESWNPGILESCMESLVITVII